MSDSADRTCRPKRCGAAPVASSTRGWALIALVHSFRPLHRAMVTPTLDVDHVRAGVPQSAQGLHRPARADGRCLCVRALVASLTAQGTLAPSEPRRATRRRPARRITRNMLSSPTASAGRTSSRRRAWTSRLSSSSARTWSASAAARERDSDAAGSVHHPAVRGHSPLAADLCRVNAIDSTPALPEDGNPTFLPRADLLKPNVVHTFLIRTPEKAAPSCTCVLLVSRLMV